MLWCGADSLRPRKNNNNNISSCYIILIFCRYSSKRIRCWGTHSSLFLAVVLFFCFVLASYAFFGMAFRAKQIRISCLLSNQWYRSVRKAQEVSLLPAALILPVHRLPKFLSKKKSPIQKGSRTRSLKMNFIVGHSVVMDCSATGISHAASQSDCSAATSSQKLSLKIFSADSIPLILMMRFGSAAQKYGEDV